MTEKIRALIGSDSPALLEQIRAITNRVETVTPAQIEGQPDLLGQVEIAYGGLRGEQIAGATRLRWLQTGGAGVEGLMPHVQAAGLTLTNARGASGRPPSRSICLGCC